MNPRDPQRVLVAVYVFHDVAAGRSRAGGTYLSTDGGVRFTRTFAHAASDLVQDPAVPRRRLRRVRHRRRLLLLRRAGRRLALGRLRPHVVALPDARFARRADPRAAGAGEGDDLGHVAARPLRLRPRRGRRARRRRALPLGRRRPHLGEADRPPADVPEGRLQPVQLRPHAPRPPDEARPRLPRHRQPLRLRRTARRRGGRSSRSTPPAPPSTPTSTRSPSPPPLPARSGSATTAASTGRPTAARRSRAVNDALGLIQFNGVAFHPVDAGVPDGRDAGQREPEDPRRRLLVRPDRQRRRLRPRPAGRPRADPRGELLRLPELLDDDRRDLPRRHADSRRS